MSLLLDARKKSQQASTHATSADELRLEDHASETGKKPGATNYAYDVEEAARIAGQNLFSAKAPLPSPGRLTLNPKLLFALGGTALLVAIGVGYLWYLDSASNTTPLRPFVAPPATPIAQAAPPIAAIEPVTHPAPQETLVPGIAKADIASTIQETQPLGKPALIAAGKDASSRQPAADGPAGMPQARTGAAPVRVERSLSEPQVEPLLNDAYFAYRYGMPDEAQRLYSAMLNKDAHNSDALLGLATLAQQRGENQMAAQYYARVLVLDPRNALANAGMASLSADSENNESRLKNLLREQGNSAALHFALGNLYAGQSRWGEAQQAYFNAYTLESDSAEFAFNLAVSLDHLGQGKLAARHYQRALQLDRPRSAGFDHAQIELRVRELTH